VSDSRQLCFSEQAQVAQKPLNDKIYCNTVKIPGQLCFPGQAQVAQKSWIIKNIYSVLWIQGTLCFYRASASCSKLLNCKKYIQYRETFQGKLCFQVKHKSIKILNIKSTFTTVKIFRATLFFSGQAQSCSKILNGKKYIQYSEKFQEKLCFQGKRMLIKILNIKSTFTTVKIFRATLCFFQGKRKLLKNRELWKNFQYGVYSLGGDPCNVG